MDRRSFLKRTTTGIAAAAAALQWKAPERPPESLALPDDEQFTAVAEVAEPIGWADVVIDGKHYRMGAVTGSVQEHEIIDDVRVDDNINRFRPGLVDPGELELDLWGPGDSWWMP